MKKSPQQLRQDLLKMVNDIQISIRDIEESNKNEYNDCWNHYHKGEISAYKKVLESLSKNFNL
jgi:hypothetical protein